MKRLGGYLALATAFVACPCHLPFTLALAAAVLGGTAVGSFLVDNAGLVAAVLIVYFIGALVLGFRLLRNEGSGAAEACPACPPDTQADTGAASRAERVIPVGTVPRGASDR